MPIELPMCELEFVGWFLEIKVDGVSVLIELPIRDVLLELIPVLGLVIVGLLMLELRPVEILVLEESEKGLEMLGEVGGREVVIRLDETLLGLLLGVIVRD